MLVNFSLINIIKFTHDFSYVVKLLVNTFEVIFFTLFTSFTHVNHTSH